MLERFDLHSFCKLVNFLFLFEAQCFVRTVVTNIEKLEWKGHLNTPNIFSSHLKPLHDKCFHNFANFLIFFYLKDNVSLRKLIKVNLETYGGKWL